MKLTIEKSVLAKEVTKALAFVERKSTIPILANLLISAEECYSVTIRATDLDTSLVASFTAKHVEQGGQATIPARKLAEVLKKLQGIDADVTIETLADNWVRVS